MKAVVYREYGSPDVLHMEDVDVPQPKRGEVLIKVQASTATAGDANLRGFTRVPDKLSGWLVRLVFGLFRPRRPILGTEIAGEIVSLGKGVTDFQVGDAVFGIDSMKLGGYAEYVCRAAKGGLYKKPTEASYEQAAALPFGAGTALYFVKDLLDVQPGQKVLVVGASGCVGHYIVQLASAFGAEVTGVCSTRNVELVRSFGARHVLDYTKEDCTQPQHGTYDIIFDVVPSKSSFAEYQKVLNPNGRYAAVAGGFKEIFQSLFNRRIVSGTPKESKENMKQLYDLFDAGTIKPFIDETYPLSETKEAHRYTDSGHKRGNVVITVSEGL